ncbi:uncharacterized protein PHACADRAFT_149773 [Phanerochaete carnosa HHB-10118-sp]|uniref:Major facilitator superfamily (MFS) profile domain-containing protein n=1 Tax=Phanerochaete carnosa (strain HHB-10118-sp) TaxID=650164 RepID=K5USH7_PHACS|nr:uncharacterized protein PHACADRAFT_149773 [Phanerochaete carnosa HHB-10118-sp]EKM52846.1 hypothetical protein PHACADRAFT_149773 [Phanerochaete carnosa HHB-10118-sp]
MEKSGTKRGFRFWMVILAICSSLFLSALELTGVATALPTIVHDLNGNDFVWVSSAYSLAATALLPMSGGLAQIFGRRITMLLSIALFALGSAMCGAAQNMNWLIAARSVQGAGGGGLLSLSSIIISDLVPLKERAIYNALIGVTWAFAAALGPLVGGGLAEHGQWRWLFYLNLPVSGVAALLVIVFLNLRAPPGSWTEKLGRMDWMQVGNVLIISSSSSVVLGLTWGGVRYAWSSARVIVPLVVGLVGMTIFVLYEAKATKNPIIPVSLLSNRTSLSGYIQTFICPVVILAAIYFVPTYLQACKSASPIRSGVLELPYAFVMGVILVVTGTTIAVSKAYRVQLWVGWVAFMVAMGLMSTVHAETSTAHLVGYTVILGFAAGIVYSATYFPVLAPLPVSENAHALALFSFFRSFAGVWGVTIGTAVLQTQLSHRLPAQFIEEFPGGVSIAYSAIPVIPTLAEPLRTQVMSAFADSLAVVWQVMTGIAGIGLVSSIFMKGLPLHTEVDENWGIEEKKRGGITVKVELLARQPA